MAIYRLNKIDDTPTTDREQRAKAVQRWRYSGDMIVSGDKKRGRSLRTGLKYMIAPFIGTLTNGGVNHLTIKRSL